MGQLLHTLRDVLRLLKPPAAVAALLALVLAVLVGGAVWMVRSQPGALWLLKRIPGLEVTGWQGELLGERVQFERLRIEWAGGQQWLVIEGLDARGLRWRWRPDGGAWVALEAEAMSARRVELHNGPPSGKPMTLPTSLALPAQLNVGAARIETLQIDALPPIRELAARVQLGTQDGNLHRIDGLTLAWDRLRASGQASIATEKPYALQASLTAEGITGPPWKARAEAGGTLSKLALAATLTGEAAVAQRAAPALDLQASVTPFAPWPLAALTLRTTALDLAALASAAPETRLSGHAEVQSSALDAPVAVALTLDNALPGRWSEKRLPLRHIELALAGNPRQRDILELTAFDLLLGDARNAAGRWSGSGRWQGGELTLDTRLDRVRPQQLDARAAAMTLSGPLAFTLRGLPSPDTAAPRPDPAPPLALQWRTTLDGVLDAAPRPVRLALEGSADAGRVEVRQLQASAGTARAEASASAVRQPAGDWQLVSTGTLAQFDPLPWWPGAEGSAWRKGPHRLSAEWKLSLRVPADAATRALPALLQSLAGNGTLKIHDSLLAGVPLQGHFELTQAAGAGRAGTPAALQGEIELGHNRLTASGQGNPAGNGEQDRLALELHAETLAELAPLFKLDPALEAWQPRQGRVEATLALEGRWPKLRTEGHASAEALKLGQLAVAKGHANWRLDLGRDQPLSLQADISGVEFGRQRLEQFNAELLGTVHQHRLLVTAAMPLGPPPMAEQLLGLRAKAGTRALLRGEGSWVPAAAGGGTWRGRVPLLAVGVWDGVALPGAVGAASAASAAAATVPDSGWVDARDLSAELVFDADGNLHQLDAAPGRMLLAGGVKLRWDAIRVRNAGARSDIELRADIEPFAVAPLLARAQPGGGWGGDLRVGARVELRAAERFDADVVLERSSGDLFIKDDSGTLPLELTQLRVALAAHDGSWTLQQAFNGGTLGVVASNIELRTRPEQRWPSPDAVLKGVVDARADNLGAWSNWVPPGWRLSGSARTLASIGGRFGAPEYSGEITGSKVGIRNLLQGVNFTDGDLAISLQGTSARIDRFSLRGGDGTLKAEGGASFGETPAAHVKLTAERFQVLGRIDRKLSASGNAELLLTGDRLKLDGRLRVDEGLFETGRGDAPTLDEDVIVIRAPQDPAEAVPEAAPGSSRPRRAVEVALDIDLGEKLRIKARGLDSALRGALRITTPGGRLAVNGTVRTEEGTYVGYGQKLEIDRGIVAFSGPAENPRLDILALRPNLDVQVGVAITGTALAPRIRLFSDPEMSDTDKLSWLVLGRAPDGLGRADLTLLQTAAMALVSGEGEGRTDALLRNIGLDTLSVRQSDGDVRETVITLGKQLSRRWYVGYERGVNSTVGTWQLIYRVAQRFTLRAQSGSENALDLIWVWRFN